MREAVVFSKPEEVNIIATRNGELTQIPGTEFRTQLAPYKTTIGISGDQDSIFLYTPLDVTCILLGICKTDSDYGYTTFARPLDIYQLEDRANGRLTTRFDAELLAGASAPGKGAEIGIIVQVIRNNATQVFDSKLIEGSVVLTPCHSERVLVLGVNPVEESSSFWKPARS